MGSRVSGSRLALEARSTSPRVTTLRPRIIAFSDSAVGRVTSPCTSSPAVTPTCARVVWTTASGRLKKKQEAIARKLASAPIVRAIDWSGLSTTPATTTTVACRTATWKAGRGHRDPHTKTTPPASSADTASTATGARPDQLAPEPSTANRVAVPPKR